MAGADETNHALLHAEIARLRTLVESSKLINSSIDDEALFASILGVASAELGVERGTLFFLDRVRGEVWARVREGGELSEIRLPLGQGLAGTVAQNGKGIVINDAYADPRFDPSVDRRTGFRTRSILCVPIHARDGKIVGVLQLLNKRDGVFGAIDLSFLEALSEHMAIAMQNAIHHLDRLEQNRMQSELALGREIQARLLPEPPDDVSGFEIAAESISCFEVGGDCYDFLRLPGGELGLAIGDVSGKGVAAALVMSSIQSALRMAASHEGDLGRLAARLNDLLHGMTRGRKYVTFFFGRLDPATGRLRYVNAGHNPPLLVHGGVVVELPTTGKPLGLLPNLSFGEGEIALPAAASLILYTDGFTEAMNASDEELGAERWARMLLDHARLPTSAFTRALLAEVTAFENGAPARDDKTLVILRRGA